MAEYLRRHRIAAVVAVVAALFALLTAGFGRGGVSGASVREWDRILPDRAPEYSGLQLGVSRPIRSDEWATSLPFVLAQCRSPEFFPRVNSSVNGGTDMFVETPCAPVWDWTALGQFHNWGYFLFGADHGLAWSWWTRYLLLPLFLFLFLLKWCGGDALLAAVGAVAVTLGAPTQWWDTTVPYHLVYLFAAVVFLRQALVSAAWWTSALSAFALAVSLASFIFVMYMPFTMLLAPVLFALAAFEFKECESRLAWWRIAFLVLALAVVCAEVLYFFEVHGEALDAVKGSSYPGSRFFRGGSFRFLCERTLADLMSFPSAFSHGHANLNKCIISEYVGLGIPLFAGVAFAAASRRRPDWMVLLLSGYAVVLFAWCAYEWPAWIARLTGLFLIPPRRASVVGGFVVLLVSLRWAAARGGEERQLPAWAAYAVAAVFFGVRAVAFCWHDEVSGWFRSTPGGLVMLASALVLSALAAFGLFARRRILFASSLVVFSIVTGCAVHPLVEGLSPIYDKKLSRTVLEIDGRAPGVWIANDRVVAQLPVALGLRAYSGTQQYSDAGYWGVVDPKSRRRDVWNRYGHRYITDLEGRRVLENRKRLDAMFYSLDEDTTRRLGVRYVIWRGNPLRLAWLRHLSSVGKDHIYEVKPVAEESSHED